MTDQKPIISLHDVSSGQVVEREMTNEEYALYLTTQENLRIAQESEAQKEADKQAILDRLGITAEELALVLGFEISSNNETPDPNYVQEEPFIETTLTNTIQLSGPPSEPII